LTVESLRGPDALPEGGRPLLELLAGTAALVLERLQLRDTVAAHREELELLASAFSHDLKAPLVLIANYAALIQKRMGQAPPSEITHYLERLRGGVRRAEALAKDLTAYLRLGRTVTRKTRVSLDSILEETRGLLAPAFEATRARLEGRDLPVVEVDRFKIGQVLFNLVDNALKYAGEGRSPRIVVSASSLPGFWRIEVVDDGPGIAPELQPALFKLFARLPEGQRIAPSGTGVGLAVVRRLVEEHGGTVGVDSAPGKGSTFWFTLPATA
jgi:signal transduction histidine kinase